LVHFKKSIGVKLTLTVSHRQTTEMSGNDPSNGGDVKLLVPERGLETAPLNAMKDPER
jgi:hypothetical protein